MRTTRNAVPPAFAQGFGGQALPLQVRRRSFFDISSRLFGS